VALAVLPGDGDADDPVRPVARTAGMSAQSDVDLPGEQRNAEVGSEID
jgi:hypothetical protein